MSSACATHPLPGLVPTAVHAIVPVVEHVRMARDTWRLRLASPELARQVIPGQFFMIRSPGVTNPLLGRPFALYDTYLDATGQPAGIDVVYLVVGKMTTLMSGWQAGNRVEVWGPLGNGFPLPDADHLLLVAGGIGNTPFLAVARQALGKRQYGQLSLPKNEKRPNRVMFCYGVRSAEYLAGLPDFDALGNGLEVRIATDDGSRGHAGFVTQLVEQVITEQAGKPRAAESNVRPRFAIYCCGPEVMMHAVARLAEKHQIPCWLSLETPMACGFGACFSCVTRVKQTDGTWDYRRVCVEGPIFPAEQLQF